MKIMTNSEFSEYENSKNYSFKQTRSAGNPDYDLSIGLIRSLYSLGHGPDKYKVFVEGEESKAELWGCYDNTWRLINE